MKNVLVLSDDLIKVTATMKRTLSLIVLLGLLAGAVLTGCNNESNTDGAGGSTNSVPAKTNAP